MTDAQFVRHLSQLIEASGLSMAAWAEQHGLPRQIVSSVLMGRRLPPPALLHAMGYQRERVIRRRRRVVDA
jgi:hypothetical protein